MSQRYFKEVGFNFGLERWRKEEESKNWERHTRGKNRGKKAGNLSGTTVKGANDEDENNANIH